MPDPLLRIIVAPSSNPSCHKGIEAYLAEGNQPRSFLEIPKVEAFDFLSELRGLDVQAFNLHCEAQLAYIRHTDWVSWADGELLAHPDYNYRFDVHIGASEIDLPLPSKASLRYSQIKQGQHFTLTGNDQDSWEWCASGDCEELGLDGGKTFEERDDAVDNARDALSLASSFGTQTACDLMDDFELHMGHLYPSSKRDILASVEVLPVDVRWHFAYSMALRTKAMHSSHWPERLCQPFDIALLDESLPEWM